jgi:hypothetical protein
VEGMAVYLDDKGRDWPAGAASIADILGQRPRGLMESFDHDRVAAALGQVHATDRDLGRSLGLG